MSRLPNPRDESGTTLVELLVATAAGCMVMLGVTVALIVTLKDTTRVTSHIDANQRARVTMSKVIEELHSACVAYDFAPVRKESGESSLLFLHQTGSAVQPTPVLTKISLSGTTLSQSNYASNGGTAPNWTFATTPSETSTLLANVSTISGVPLFRYYAYKSGGISTTPLEVPLSQEHAEKTVQVSVAFKANPLTKVASDSNAATAIQDSALLRLTPASFETESENPPCA